MSTAGQFLCIPVEWTDKNGQKRFNTFFINKRFIETGVRENNLPLEPDNFLGVNLQEVIKEMAE